MSNQLLRTDSLSIGYSNGKIIAPIAVDVDIRLHASDLVALIGANGIGKSTLLRTISGIQKPLSGKVFVDDSDLSRITNAQLAQKIALVLTEKLPPSNLTVREIVALGRQPYTNWLGTLTPADISTVSAALEVCEITHLADQKYYQLSDGQLQKVMIARALAQDTPLIILDEPTTHLDLQHKASLFKMLKKLVKETNKCILFSTHEIDMAIQMSDTIIVMSDKKVIQDRPKNLIENNIFDAIFSDSTVYFDKNLGKFVIRDF